MSRKNTSFIGDLDWLVIAIYLALVGIGWAMIYSVTYDANSTEGLLTLKTDAGKQLIFVIASLFVWLVVMILDVQFFKTFAYLIYSVSILLLIAVLFFGKNINGARSWFDLGVMTFQPSELAKVATALALSYYMNTYGFKINDTKNQMIALLIFGLPMFLILIQSDAGSALVFLAFLIVLFREGFEAAWYVFGILMATLFVMALIYPPIAVIAGLLIIGTGILARLSKKRSLTIMWFVGILVAVGIHFGLELADYYSLIPLALSFIVLYVSNWLNRVSLAHTIFWGLVFSAGFTFSVNYAFNEILQPHQQDRIKVWLMPQECSRDIRYNIDNSMNAIGSGGLEGTGYLQGKLTRGGFVPEQFTDFIFCTVGEEQGFIGTFGVIILFLLLLLKTIAIAERQRSKFTRNYAYGVAGILSLHLLVNVGMTVGVMPVIGIPLPFISYGGSSLLGFSLLLAILVKLDSQRYVMFR